MSWYDIVQLIIAILSLIATVLISIILYALERKREEQIDLQKENIKRINLEHEAEIFLIKNGDEIDFLPLCVFANYLNGTKKHKREIYNNYNICSDELKEMILAKQGIYIRSLPDKDWFNYCNDKFESMISSLDLGRNMYYDDAKYVRYCLEDYADECLPKIKLTVEFTDYDIKNGVMIKRGIYNCSLLIYVRQYFKYLQDIKKYKNPDEIVLEPPCDVVYKIAVENERGDYCYWCAHQMRYLCAKLREYDGIDSFYGNSYSQAIEIQEKYFEDIYYCAVYELYLTFGKHYTEN